MRLSVLSVVLLGFYGLIVNGLLLARWLLGETTLIALLMPLFPLLLIPALILLPLMLLLRRPRLLLWLAPAALVFVAFYGARFIPRSVEDTGETLRLATYNLRAQSSGLDALTRVIAELDADIITLQEVSQEAADHIQATLGDVYPEQIFATRDSPYYGTGILSRLPVLSDYIYPFEPDRLRMQRAQFRWNERSFTVFNFHAQPVDESWRPPDVNIRRDQVIYLLEEMAQVGEAHLVTGDFNFNEFTEDYGLMTARSTDAFQAVGWGLGLTGPHWGNLEYPTIGPPFDALLPAYQRFDYAFHDEQFHSVSAQVWPDYGGSDHQPLVVELTWAS